MSLIDIHNMGNLLKIKVILASSFALIILGLYIIYTAPYERAQQNSELYPHDFFHRIPGTEYEYETEHYFAVRNTPPPTNTALLFLGGTVTGIGLVLLTFALWIYKRD